MLDKEQIAAWKTIVTKLIRLLESLETDLNAQEILLLGLNDAYPEEHLLEKLEELRRNPTLRRDMHEKYAVPLESFLKAVDELGVVQSLDLLRPAKRKPDQEN